MKQFLYETHLHTSQASACGKVKGADYIDYMKSKGYQGIIVTDHFFNGNSCVPYNLFWKDRVEWYCSGYEDALEASKGKDFDVLFGIEFNFRGDEYLIYGVDKKWLLDNDDILRLSREEVYKRVHQGGGVMIQAHPYRDRYYISEIILTPGICDAIEIYNAANPDNENALGYHYALELNVPMTSGSDIHFFYEGAMGGMLLPTRISSPSEYAELVMKNDTVPVRVLDGKNEAVTDITELTVPVGDPTLPVKYGR
ncbi:MAG: PHP domain-containing protein [Eubacterium sp.]|nr:PHP domain-containing protein [Eubacterium sp.]